jgi:hypothetical protein
MKEEGEENDSKVIILGTLLFNQIRSGRCHTRMLSIDSVHCKFQ